MAFVDPSVDSVRDRTDLPTSGGPSCQRAAVGPEVIDLGGTESMKGMQSRGAKLNGRKASRK